MDIINKTVSINQLLLDPNNFRLNYDASENVIDEEFFIQAQSDTLEKLEEENIEELRQSILENGFIEIDRIVVKKSKILKLTDELPYYIVIEGNRRSAALKTLYDDYIKNRIEVSSELLAQFEAINVCLINSEDEDKVVTLSASLMGIRHVSGPKKWKGVQAAKLIHQLRMINKGYREIAHLLGVDEADAKRRHEGFLAFKQMKNDPEYGEKCDYNHYALLLEFISNRHSQEWLEWNGTTFENSTNRGCLYRHLTKSEIEKRAEINNTGEARLFNRYLTYPEFRAKISAGILMSELPDLPKDNAGKVSYITKFNTFLINLSDSDQNASDDILDKLRETAHLINEICGINLSNENE